MRAAPATTLTLFLAGTTLSALACRSASNATPGGTGASVDRPLSGRSHHGAGNTTSSSTDEPPRLVILLVVDQLPSWSFARDARLLSGGLARLMREGVYYATADFPYALTETAVGHATLGTGASPADTGIIGNQWYVPAQGRRVSSTADPDSPVFRVIEAGPDAAGSPGVAGKPGTAGADPASASLYTGDSASGAMLAVEGVADVLRRATNGRGRSVAIANKARAAILALGQRPDLAVWYDPGQPAMTTSRYYAAALPGWLVKLAADHPIAPRLGYVWRRLASVDHGALTGSVDAAPGEGFEYGMGIVFPHDLARSESPARALLASPLGDELAIETALAAIDGMALGADDVPDVLSVSFSAPDYCGHYWGQESWERLDEFLRLDHAIDGFLEEVDRRIGQGRYAVLLTGDHGATRLVERTRAEGRPAHRIDATVIAKEARTAAAEVLGPGTWVADVTASTVSMSQAFTALDAAPKNETLDAIVHKLLAIPGLTYATATERITGRCDERRGLDLFACNSVIAGLSGEVFYAPAPGSLVTTPEYHTGTNHGSPNPEDRTVPIVVMAPGWRPGMVGEPVSMLQVAPTLARLLHIPPPSAARAAPLAPAP